MAHDKDLFEEEKTMVAMSFGDHIEELRLRLILAMVGLTVGVVLTFIPPFYLGVRVMDQMQGPARIALKKFYADRYRMKAEKSELAKTISPPVQVEIPAAKFLDELDKLGLKLQRPDAGTLVDAKIRLPMSYVEADQIKNLESIIEPPGALVSLAPLETVTILMMVCLVVGLVIASPWVFYQAWAFVGAGLYRHERNYVTKFLPFSLGLFLSGVFLCFFGVLPVTLGFLLDFNIWLGIEPTLRLSDWMNFATILPLVFGVSFQTPLIMLFLERIGIFTAADFRAKRKIAILIMVVAAAILTPGPDVFSQCMLAVPMIGLYELGILMIPKTPRDVTTAAA